MTAANVAAVVVSLDDNLDVAAAVVADDDPVVHYHPQPHAYWQQPHSASG